MHRQNIIAAGFILFASVLVVSVGYAKGWGPLGVINSSINRLTGGGSRLISPDRVASETDSPIAPDFAPGTWINSGPLTIKGLQGRVVLVQFWTFGCYNCRNTLPAVKRWHERYNDKGLTIVGVHAPEFDAEKQIEKVRSEVASLGIRYPVVTDNDYETWRAYGVEAWPTNFVLDKSGRVRSSHVGEGAYDETERLIQQLLAEDKTSVDMPKTEKVGMSENVKKTNDEWRQELSPEQYHVLREAGTERAFTGAYWDHHEKGVYLCAACGLELFSSTTKFDSGTGWPSFSAPISEANVIQESDRSAGMMRTEVKCRRCGSHLGHVFDDGPKPTGLRYCMNSVSLKFEKTP